MKKRVSFAFLLVMVSSCAFASIAIDATSFRDRSSAATSIATPAFSTAAGNELLLAFVSTDSSSPNMTVTSVSGAGLTWTRVVRANQQLGTAEIWRAFATSKLTSVTVTATLAQSVAASIVVVAFTGTDTSGTGGSGAIGAIASASAASGAPTATLTPTRNGSWVFGVGTDWDNRTARTVGPGQALVHQYLASVGDTYWVQRQNGPTSVAGTPVTINDTAPTTDRYNLSICEILPASGSGGTPTYTISGTVTPASVGSGATITLSGAASATVTADGSGNYSFGNLANGTYTVTPSKSGVSFTPPSSTVTISGAPAPGVNFTASAVTYTLSGTVSPSSVGSTTTLTLSGAGSGTITPDGSGNYTFSNLPNGTYTVTPTKSGYSFTPPSSTVTINGAPITGVNFTAAAVTYGISGSISPIASGVGTLLTLTGAGSGTATANASANYSFTGLAAGTYTVTPSKNGFTFSPGSRTLTITTTSATAINFTATAVPAATISGTISPSSLGAGSIITLSGAPSAYTVADSAGNYSFSNVPSGTYQVSPSKSGFTFSPSSLSVVLNGGPGSTGNNFTAQALPASALKPPDLSDILPPGAMSITGTGASRMFQYTHDTYNGGPGPLEIQPVYNSTSGNYQGIQHIYSQNASGQWTLAQSIPVAAAFVFHPEHGHFHFPLTSYAIHTSNPDGTIGSLVASSDKVGFCIADSFMYDSLVPNAGAFGNWGSCGDPTSLRGLTVGAVDEYDQTDQGQAISIVGVPDGTYWLRAIVDPQNLLAEGDKSNNETDVQLTMSGTTVQVLQIVQPILPPPPSVTLTNPLNGTQVGGTVQLTASTPVSGGTVQYLVDGLPFGGAVTTAPYTLSWNTTALQNGTHWLAAQVTDAAGHIGTSTVVTVTVSNGTSSNPPTVQITDPTSGQIVSAAITIAATVASQNGNPSVQFYVDGAPVGPLVTAPPYNTFWNTQSLADGTHVVNAKATDALGLVGDSQPVSVTVDNSHPPNVIGIDANVFRDGSGTMTSPSFSTTTNSDLIIAFVAYDGPLSSPQTATISGAGLNWTLLKRSNAQAGTAEVWAAKASTILANATIVAQMGAGTNYHGMLVVVAFKNASGPGTVGQASAPSGAPDIYLPGVAAGNWVFAVGNDWDNPIARTPVSGQVLVHQFVDTQVGDTYWVQSTAGPSTANGLVTIHDTAPTTDRWNYAAVEIVATRQ